MWRLLQRRHDIHGQHKEELTDDIIIGAYQDTVIDDEKDQNELLLRAD